MRMDAPEYRRRRSTTRRPLNTNCQPLLRIDRCRKDRTDRSVQMHLTDLSTLRPQKMQRPVLLLAFLLGGVSAFAATESAYAATDRPNVVIIYGDDIGFGDVGAYGAEKIPTPHLDRLASEGLMFTDAHCSAATCSPSRFSLLTGIHGFRHGVRVLPPNAPLKVPLDVLTLPKLFQNAGYTTAVIGKWHLGLGNGNVNWNEDIIPGPLEVGFDYSYLLPSTNDRVPCVYVENHRVVNLDSTDPLSVGEKIDDRSTV